MIGGNVVVLAKIPFTTKLMFSSTSSIWSQSGGGHYAAANLYLDGLAMQEQKKGLAALAVQFGPFAETGMAAEYVNVLSSLGLRSLTPRQVPLSNFQSKQHDGKYVVLSLMLHSSEQSLHANMMLCFIVAFCKAHCCLMRNCTK